MNIAEELQKCGFIPAEKDYIELMRIFIDPITNETFDVHINDYYLKKG